MITANELRIGNWILAPNGEKKFVENISETLFNILIDGDGVIGGYSLKEYSGIPLSGELLVKCGFEKRKLKEWDEFILPIGDDLWVIQISIANDDKIIYSVLMANGGYDDAGEKDLSALCKYLHQLQNLYFALTNTELPINLSNQ